MTTRCDVVTAASLLKTSEDWLVSHNNGFKANIIVWGMPKGLLEIRAKLAGRLRSREFCLESLVN